MIYRTSYELIFSIILIILIIQSDVFSKPINEDEFDPRSYLEAYEYLTDENETNAKSISVVLPHRNNDYQSAIAKFQQSRGLNVTGVIDNATMELMKKPRCGMKVDTLRSLRRNEVTLEGPHPRLWNRTLRTYRIQSFTSYQQLNRLTQESMIDDAFHEWSTHVPLTFEKVCEICTADIVIEFIDDELGKHRDNDKPARFRPLELAHAALPWQAYPVFIHFNKRINYTDSFNSTKPGTNLFHIAVHEIGHVLGLGHTLSHKTSVMHPDYPDPYNKTKRDYLSMIDQDNIQNLYGKREKSAINRCSSWSSLARPQNISVLSSLKSKHNEEFVTESLSTQHQWNLIAKDRIYQEKSTVAIENRHLADNSLHKKSIKSSGGIIKNEYDEYQSFFFDRFDNLYVSDYGENRVIVYKTVDNQQRKISVAEHLNTPRALYVTNDGNLLYVVDHKGVHRFKLDREDGNMGAATLLFPLASSSEIYTMIVDEVDFHTIYLYDTTRQKISRCSTYRFENWKCRTIINLTVEDSELTKHASMVLDTQGNLLLVDETTNVVILYKHIKNGCRITTKKPSTTTASTTVVYTEKPRKNGMFDRIISFIIDFCFCFLDLYPVNNTILILKSKQTNRVLSCDSNKITHTRDFNGDNLLRWLFIRQQDDTYVLQNLATSEVLYDTSGFILTNDFHDDNSQKWTLTRQEDNSYVLTNVAYPKVLDSNHEGSIYRHSPNGGTFQQWFLLPASVEPYDNMIAVLTNKQTNKDLGGNTQQHLFTLKYNGDNNQKWCFHRQKDDTYILKNLATSDVLDSNSRYSFTRSLNDNTSQKWKLIRQEDGSYVLENVAFKRVLDSNHIATVYPQFSNEINYQRWFFFIPSLNPYNNYHGSENQKWKFHLQDDGHYVLKNVGTSLVLETKEECIGTNDFEVDNSRKWIVLRREDGTYTFKNAANSRILDSNAGASYSYVSHGIDHQKWFLEPT